MNELLDDALEDFKERLLAVPFGTAVFSENYTKNFHNGENESEANLRLDWEVPGDHVEAADQKLINLMFEQMKLDLADLIENGDAGQTTDPLLKSIDGIRVRSQQPVFIDITVGETHAEYHYRKDTTEITTYLRLYIKWE